MDTGLEGKGGRVKKKPDAGGQVKVSVYMHEGDARAF